MRFVICVQIDPLIRVTCTWQRNCLREAVSNKRHVTHNSFSPPAISSGRPQTRHAIRSSSEHPVCPPSVGRGASDGHGRIRECEQQRGLVPKQQQAAERRSDRRRGGLAGSRSRQRASLSRSHRLRREDEGRSRRNLDAHPSAGASASARQTIRSLFSPKIRQRSRTFGGCTGGGRYGQSRRVRTRTTNSSKVL
jgi:hypothetical protein